MTKKLKSHAIAVAKFTSACLAGAAFVVGFGFAVAALSSTHAWPQDLAATAPVPQPRPPAQPEVMEVPAKLVCMDFKAAEAELHKIGRFNIGGGISGNELVTLIYATPDMREWTIMTLNANGIACFVLSGNFLDFKQIERRAA